MLPVWDKSRTSQVSLHVLVGLFLMRQWASFTVAGVQERALLIRQWGSFDAAVGLFSCAIPLAGFRLSAAAVAYQGSIEALLSRLC